MLNENKRIKKRENNSNDRRVFTIDSSNNSKHNVTMLDTSPLNYLTYGAWRWDDGASND